MNHMNNYIPTLSVFATSSIVRGYKFVLWLTTIVPEVRECVSMNVPFNDWCSSHSLCEHKYQLILCIKWKYTNLLGVL
jgi:hypothetical protein